MGHRSITGSPLSPSYLLTLKGVAHLPTPAPVAELAEDTFTRVCEARSGLLGHTRSARRTGAPTTSAALPITGLLLLLRVVTVHVTVHDLCSVQHLPVIGNMPQPARDNPRHVHSCHPGVELRKLLSVNSYEPSFSLRGRVCLDAMMLLDIIKYIVNTLK